MDLHEVVELAVKEFDYNKFDVSLPEDPEPFYRMLAATIVTTAQQHNWRIIQGAIATQWAAH